MSGQDLQAKMAALKADYSARLPGKVREIEETWEQLQEDWSEETLRNLRLKAHTLKGGALSFGFPLLGGRAGVLEDQLLVLSQDRLPNSRQKADIAYLIERLAEALVEQTDTTPLLDPTLPEGKGLIYLIDPDDELVTMLGEKLRQQGFQTRRLGRLGELPGAIRQRPPTALFLDLQLHEGEHSCAQALFNLRKVYQQNLPVVFASARDDMAARLAATRAGGRAFFVRPVAVQAVVETLVRITLPAPVRTYRVLIVDEVGAVGSRYQEILKEAGMQCRLLRQPLHFLRVWGEFLPTLTLVASRQTSVNTADLLATLRQQERFRRQPILLFADAVDQSVETVVREGLADSLVWNNISAEALLSTIVNQVENAERLLSEARVYPTRDPLTHCLNRQGLLIRLDQEEHRAHMPTPLAVLAIRLLNYRDVDRRFGFEAGDRMLREVASTLYRRLEASDTLARFSDGIFVILSIQRLLPAARQLADGLCQSLEALRLSDTGGVPVHPACAIGIGVFDRATPSPRQALINALAASDNPELRAGGIEFHRSSEALRLAAQRHAEWQARLTEALAEHRLFLTFQPIASLHGEPHHYYDVFVRMNGDVPEETIPAAEFVPVAEQSGLIGELDRWVLEQAVSILAARIRQGDRQASLFLRLSGQSLTDEDFIAWIRLQLTEYALPGEVLNLTLSVTEITRQFDRLQQFAGRIRALDCRLGIADVSNDPRVFQALKRLPVSFVKVQTTIIQALRRDREAVRQLRAICHRAHDQGLTVIAPCVEDAESLNILWSNGVDYIEGFFIHPPELSLNYDFGEL